MSTCQLRISFDTPPLRKVLNGPPMVRLNTYFVLLCWGLVLVAALDVDPWTHPNFAPRAHPLIRNLNLTDEEVVEFYAKRQYDNICYYPEDCYYQYPIWTTHVCGGNVTTRTAAIPILPITVTTVAMVTGAMETR